MSNDKIFKLTKNEAYFLKKILPSCKLTAYQIPLFQSVMESLDNPIKINDQQEISICAEPIQEPRTNYIPKVPPLFKVNKPENEENLNKIEQHFQSPGMVKPIAQDRPIETSVPEIEKSSEPDLDIPTDPHEHSSSMFDVIDSRTK